MDSSYSTSSPPSATDDDLYITVQGLKGRQSVRATFRLPEQSIKLLGIMARQLGLKQKSLFDQLIEDSETLSKLAVGIQDSPDKHREHRRQKTFVLSKRSLEILDQVARQHNISRDLLVEITIARLVPIMNAEQHKHGLRMDLLREMDVYRDGIHRLLEKTKKKLGPEDPATQLLEKIIAVYEESVEELEEIVENGQEMEEYG